MGWQNLTACSRWKIVVLWYWSTYYNKAVCWMSVVIDRVVHNTDTRPHPHSSSDQVSKCPCRPSSHSSSCEAFVQRLYRVKRTSSPTLAQTISWRPLYQRAGSRHLSMGTWRCLGRPHVISIRPTILLLSISVQENSNSSSSPVVVYLHGLRLRLS